MEVSVYDAQADTINVDDIATDSNNRQVLRCLKRNEADDESNELYIKDLHEDYGNCVEYCPEGADDMGWLGYFVSKNDHLQSLVIKPFTPSSGASVRDIIVPFLRGVNQNKSIREIVFAFIDLLGGNIFTMLTPFFINNHNLIKIEVHHCDLGGEGAHLFALAIGNDCTNKSLKAVVLRRNNIISDEGMVDVITSLSMHPQLQTLTLVGNGLRKNVCVALATLLRCSAKELQSLCISHNGINDEGIEALVPTLTNCYHLRELWMNDNPTITTRGWQSLATILEAPNSNLERLDIAHNNVDDDTVASFANALTNNHTLHVLNMNYNPSITNVGWQAFSKVLCDTSSVNVTFLSNHTLYYLRYANEIRAMQPLLDLNRRDDKKEVAMIKILMCHDHFDMLPFFEWEFKVLPMVLGWLERASSFRMPRNFEPNIDKRKLSTIYQFVRGMPVLYVETRLHKELEDLKEEQRMLSQRMRKFDRRLRYHSSLGQRNLAIEERKVSIMTALGRQ